jgi:hypothetical protein
MKNRSIRSYGALRWRNKLLVAADLRHVSRHGTLVAGAG